MGAYEDTYRRWQQDPEGFWAEQAALIEWERPPDRILDSSEAPIHRWFPGGRMNTCDQALDRHVRDGRGDQLALVHDSAMTGTVRRYTYRELRDATARFAGALRREGVGQGDRVVIYMPMVPEAVVAMLACARLGAIHSVVFGGFAAHELASRIDDSRPVVVCAASCGLEPGRVVEYMPLLERALELADHRPARCIVLQRPEAPGDPRGGSRPTWEEALDGATPADPVAVEATDPLYILYTSGTTGQPEGHRPRQRRARGRPEVVDGRRLRRAPGRDLLGRVRHRLGRRPLVHRLRAAPAGLHVGDLRGQAGRDAGRRRLLARLRRPRGGRDVHRARRRSARSSAPTRRGSMAAAYDLSRLRTLFLAGERSDPDTLEWAGRLLGKPVIDHWWQTETGWAIAANCMGIEPLPVKPGSPTRAVPGYDVQVLDEAGGVAAGGGDRAHLRAPAPAARLHPTLWNATTAGSRPISPHTRAGT